ncbi:hypothetical protein J15TS10_28320 [Paenibacillus woosongensis]|uniref:Uncharacterized protein n=1 Tax=Paenibacillus woosongensis TaxID=307580 RepID=A0ABQ4MSV1_9BACL|nr:hypothetical protein J15TS10_28320 [Paenibacillus woosongensis]
MQGAKPIIAIHQVTAGENALIETIIAIHSSPYDTAHRSGYVMQT